MENEYIFVTYLPNQFKPMCYRFLAWSISEGWIDLYDREVSVFSKEEVILANILGAVPSSILPVMSIHVDDVEKLERVAVASLN